MDYGSSLFIKLVDKKDYAYYTEPFTIVKYDSRRTYKEALGIFETNAADALDSIVNDIETNHRLRSIDEYDLASALRARGWTVVKQQ